MKQQFDRWYSQEMRAPDGSYIQRLQDIPPKEWAKVKEEMLWEALFEREIFGTVHGIPVNK